MLAAATLVLLIALPMVNCRRRNALRIEELDEDLSAKNYDHRKRDNGMAMNAYSSDLRIIEKEELKKDDCKIAFKTLMDELKNCSCHKTFNKRIMCETIKNCHCSGSGDSCDECEWKVSRCLLYTSPSPRDQRGSRMPSSA